VIKKLSSEGKFWFFSLLFIFSGSSGLIYQVVWARKLQLSFGVSIFAISAVLAAYFLGMAVGSFIGGRYSDRLKRPLLVYGLAEVGIGITALIVTPYVDRLDVALRPFNSLWQDSFVLMQSARFALTLALLLVPTTLLGATVPLMNRGLISQLDHLGSRVSILYAANTVGAVIGVIVSGFYLIERIGLNATVLVAASLSIAVGILAIIGGRVVQNNERAGSRAVPESNSVHDHRSVSDFLLLLVMGISGAMGLGLEVVWTRVLIQGLGSTAYVFSAVLAIFLVGIALGSHLVRKHVDRGSKLALKLGLCAAAIGLFTLLGIPMLTWVMPRLVSQLFMLIGLDMGRWYFLAWMIWSAGALLPATIALGATFPLAVRLISRNAALVGQGIGKLYAVNTYGGVIGATLAGFVLLPKLGIHGTLLTISLTYAVLALLLAYRAAGDRQSFVRYVGLPVTVIIVLALLLPGSMVRARMTLAAHGKVTHYQEDYYGSIVVTEEEMNNERYKRLAVNGASYSGTGPYAMHYMRLQGHLPMIMYPGSPKNALVICYGVGLTAGSLSTYPDVTLDVVELSKAVLELSHEFEDVNEQVQYKRNVTVIVDDGRNFLVRHPDKRYDVITLEPPPPVQAGMANLYSRDFYRLARGHLTADGIMVQWVPIHTQNEADTQMLLATFLDVFPQATLWWTETGETLVMGSMSAKPLPPGHIGRIFGLPEVRRSLEQIGIRTPVELASHFLLDAGGLKDYVASAPRMTDDLPMIEYRAPGVNKEYKATLNHMFLYRPSVERIAQYLGLERHESSELATARQERENLWMSRRYFETE
jgi:spermidine synthase